MEKNSYLCDVCGKNISDWIKPTFDSIDNTKLTIKAGANIEADICSDCLSAIQKLVKERGKK